MELLTLPREIVGEILSHVSVSELHSLHLVSKEISELTYKYFKGEVLDPDMEKVERLKYKRMREVYTRTACHLDACRSTTRRQIYCEEHSLDIRPLMIPFIQLENGSEIEVQTCNNFPNNDLVFRTVRGGYLECIGCIENTMVGLGVKPIIVDEVSIKDLNGHKYNPLKVSGKLIYKDCPNIYHVLRRIFHDSEV